MKSILIKWVDLFLGFFKNFPFTKNSQLELMEDKMTKPSLEIRKIVIRINEEILNKGDGDWVKEAGVLKDFTELKPIAVIGGQKGASTADAINEQLELAISNLQKNGKVEPVFTYDKKNLKEIIKNAVKTEKDFLKEELITLIISKKDGIEKINKDIQKEDLQRTVVNSTQRVIINCDGAIESGKNGIITFNDIGIKNSKVVSDFNSECFKKLAISYTKKYMKEIMITSGGGGVDYFDKIGVSGDVNWEGLEFQDVLIEYSQYITSRILSSVPSESIFARIKESISKKITEDSSVIINMTWRTVEDCINEEPENPGQTMRTEIDNLIEQAFEDFQSAGQEGGDIAAIETFLDGMLDSIKKELDLEIRRINREVFPTIIHGIIVGMSNNFKSEIVRIAGLIKKLEEERVSLLSKVGRSILFNPDIESQNVDTSARSALTGCFKNILSQLSDHVKNRIKAGEVLRDQVASNGEFSKIDEEIAGLANIIKSDATQEYTWLITFYIQAVSNLNNNLKDYPLKNLLLDEKKVQKEANGFIEKSYELLEVFYTNLKLEKINAKLGDIKKQVDFKINKIIKNASFDIDQSIVHKVLGMYESKTLKDANIFLSKWKDKESELSSNILADLMKEGAFSENMSGEICKYESSLVEIYNKKPSQGKKAMRYMYGLGKVLKDFIKESISIESGSGKLASLAKDFGTAKIKIGLDSFFEIIDSHSDIKKDEHEIVKIFNEKLKEKIESISSSYISYLISSIGENEKIKGEIESIKDLAGEFLQIESLTDSDIAEINNLNQ